MKNIIKIITLIIFSGLLVTSCSSDEDTGNVSQITSYPIITLNGSSEIFIEQGAAYTEEGAVSTEDGAEIETVISYGNGTYFEDAGVDTSSPDQYIVSYSATNKDGFSGSAFRTVWVAKTGDLVNSIEGLYLASVQRAPDFAVTAQYTDLAYVIIKSTGTNTYEISHAIGGYYDYGRSYGPGFAARGAVITANSIILNDFSISQAEFPVWGNVVDITEFTVDSGSKTITFTGDGNFGNGTFKVQLTQVEL